MTVSAPQIWTPRNAQAFPWAVIGKYVGELAVALGATLIANIVTKKYIDPWLNGGTSPPPGPNPSPGSDASVPSWSQIPTRTPAAVPAAGVAPAQVKTAIEKAKKQLVETDFGNFEETKDVFAKDGVVILSGMRHDDENGCVAFIVLDPSKMRTVMIEGPTVMGMNKLKQAVVAKRAFSHAELSEILLPIQDIKPDLGKFDKNYDAKHQTRAGQIATEYKLQEPRRGRVTTAATLLDGSTLRVNYGIKLEA